MREIKNKERGFGPHLDFELDRIESWSWKDLRALGPQTVFLELKAAARTSVRNRAAIKASAKDNFRLGSKIQPNRKIIRYKVKSSRISLEL